MAKITKKGKSRKALKALSANEVNISAGKPLLSARAEKENRAEGLSLLLSPNHKTIKPISKPKTITSISTEKSLADELKEVQRRLEKLRLEKEKTEELLTSVNFRAYNHHHHAEIQAIFREGADRA